MLQYGADEKEQQRELVCTNCNTHPWLTLFLHAGTVTCGGKKVVAEVSGRKEGSEPG